MEAVTPIPKIRAGNEFTFVWAISRDGIAENLTDAAITDLKLTVCVGGLCAERVEVPFTIIDTNKIQSSHLYERTGTYNLELTYKKAGVENEIDIEAFKIVSRSAEASESSDFAVSSDMAIGFKGDKGDNEYVTWLSQGNEGTYDDYLAVLQQPATEAAGTLTEAVNLKLGEADTAIQNADTKATLANTATNLANDKAALADAAALNADAKATLANTAANLANAAAAAIEPAVIDNEQVQAETYNNLHARISALEEMTRNGVYSYIQAETIVGVRSLQFKGAELILVGTAAPAIAPDFVGQIFVNTTGGVTYMAKGIASAADWKQTSN